MMNKRRMIGLGILGFGVVCMMLNASANMVLFRGFGEGLSDWSITTDGGTVGRSSDYYHKGAGMSISAPVAQSKAQAISGVISTYDGSQYTLSMYIRPTSSSYHWFYVVWNGNVKCIMGNSAGTMTLQLVKSGGGCFDIATLTKDTWYLLKFDVTPTGASPSVDVYLDNVLKLEDKALFTTPATTQIWMGDDTTNANYGSMIFDNILIQKSDGTKTYLYETFNTGGWREWSLNSGGVPGYQYGSISLDEAANHYWTDNTLSLKIRSPAGNNKAWAGTPTYSINANNKYTVAFWIYLKDTDNHYMYVPMNGHIKCIIDGESGSNKLQWIKGASVNNVATLSTGEWHYILFNVKPIDKKYDIIVDNDVNNPVTANFCLDNAWDRLYFGDDTTDANYGWIYIDDVRLDQ